ncbi:MAG TPA: hypothetical protein VIX37_02315 [Candidatus Sulfotelmatobacter sp.]
MPRSAGGVPYRTLAAQLVQAISLAMSFIPERCGESAGIKVRALRQFS